LRRPASPEDEKLIAQWLSAVTLWPTMNLPGELWDDVGPDAADKPPDAVS